MSFLLLIGSHFFLRAPFFPGFYLPMATCLWLCNWAWSLWFYYFWGTSLVMPFSGLWALLLCLISSIWLAAFTCFQHLQWFSLHIEIPQCLPHISPCKSSRIRCLVSMEFKKQVLWCLHLMYCIRRPTKRNGYLSPLSRLSLFWRELDIPEQNLIH